MAGIGIDAVARRAWLRDGGLARLAHHHGCDAVGRDACLEADGPARKGGRARLQRPAIRSGHRVVPEKGRSGHVAAEPRHPGRAAVPAQAIQRPHHGRRLPAGRPEPTEPGCGREGWYAAHCQPAWALWTGKRRPGWGTRTARPGGGSNRRHRWSRQQERGEVDPDLQRPEHLQPVGIHVRSASADR